MFEVVGQSVGRLAWDVVGAAGSDAGQWAAGAVAGLGGVGEGLFEPIERSELEEPVLGPGPRKKVAAFVRLIEKLRAVADEMIAEAFGGIDPKDIAITRAVLTRVRENAARTATLNRASNQ